MVEVTEDLQPPASTDLGVEEEEGGVFMVRTPEEEEVLEEKVGIHQRLSPVEAIPPHKYPSLDMALPSHPRNVAMLPVQALPLLAMDRPTISPDLTTKTLKTVTF